MFSKEKQQQQQQKQSNDDRVEENALISHFYVIAIQVKCFSLHECEFVLQCNN